jgi:hypothetical protein
MGRPLFEQSTVWLRGLIEAMDEIASSTAKPSAADRKALANRLKLPAMLPPVCTENLIRVDDVMESPKLAE